MTLLLATIAVLLLLAWVNMRIGGNVLYPAALFALIWAATLTALALTGTNLYPVHAETLFLLVLGPVGFSIGAALGAWSGIPQRWARVDPEQQARTSRVVRKALDVLLVIILVFLPPYFLHIRGLAAQTGIDNFLIATRVRSLASYESPASRLPSIDNIVYISLFTAFALVVEDDGTRARRLRSVVAIAAAFALMSTGGAVGGAVTAVNAFMVLIVLRMGYIRWRYVAIYLLTVLSVFGAGAVYLMKGDVDPNLAFVQNFRSIWNVFLLYMTGGIVAFDRVVTGAEAIPNPWSIWRAVMEIANHFGTHFQIPSINAQYANVANDQPFNVFTMYFGYWSDFGVRGVLLIPIVLGWGLASLYAFAKLRVRPAMLLYSLAAASLIFGVFSEGFFIGLNYWIKAAAFFFVLYYGANLISRPGTRVISRP